MFKKLCLAALVGTFFTFNPAQAEAKREYILATATTGGTFYPVGVALATLVKVKLKDKGFALSAISSAGSDENIRLMKKNEAQFALLQGLYGYDAWNGVGAMKDAGKQNNLRSVSMLWQNVEHFILAADKVKTDTVADLLGVKGDRLALGAKNSGTLGSNAVLLSGLGIDIFKDYSLFYGGYSPSADALQNHQVVGVSIPAGVPAGAVTKLFAAMGDKAKLLDITDEQLAKMDGGRGLWSRYVIPKGTYVSVDHDVKTIAQPLLLAVNADVPEEDVYQLTKAMYDNLAFLQGMHAATKAMTLQKAIVGLPMPLHPGAARFYREKGLTIPDNLIAK